VRLAIRIFTILALGAIAAAAAVFVTAVQPVQYRSTSVLLIPGAGSGADNEAVVRSLEALLVSPPVAADIAARAESGLTPGEVVDRMTVTRPPDSAVLEVAILDTDQKRSLDLARESGPALMGRLASVAQTGQLPALEEYTVVTVNGEPATDVVEPPRARNGVIGLVIGLLLGAGLAFWRPRRSQPISSEMEASEAFDTPLYATLPILGSGSWRDHSLDVPEEQLPIGWPPAARRLVVLGAGGRPSVRLVELLASAIAQSGRDVLLVDADPEERGLTATFGHNGRPGFFECLSGRADPVASTVPLDFDHIPQEMSDLVPPDEGRISLLPSGDIDVAPAVLAGARVTHLMRRLPLTHDTIIVHAPRLPGPYPVNQFVEFADAVVVAAVAGRTQVQEAQLMSRLVMSLTGAPMYVVLLTGGARRARSGGSRRVTGQRRLRSRDATPPSVAANETADDSAVAGT
jgi:capsular polysaccharide biosynthesis protein/Mrp family chromosome partitioning ATPase